MSRKTLKKPKVLSNKTFKPNKKNIVIIALICSAVLIGLIAAVFFFTKKEPKTYDEYMELMSQTLAMDKLATDASGAYQDLETQIGYDAYEALVLGVPVEEGSLYYETQQNNLGAAKNEAEYAQGLVKQHEAEIRAKGGIVSLEDLQNYDTNQYSDAMARAKIQGRYDEYITNLTAGGDKALEEARRAAAYEE